MNVKRFKINNNGKDYVVGDLHGCYDYLMQKLNDIGFKKSQDRLFAVGDLIDRGKDSLKVLELLNEKWFFSVRGNHEDMALSGELHQMWFVNGGLWWFSLSEEEQNYATSLMEKLPLIIEIETKDGLVGVAHAEIPENLTWEEVKESVESDDEKLIAKILWSRNLIKKHIASGIEYYVEGISKIFCGHTPLKNYIISGSTCHIDTGAVYYGVDNLTILEI